MKKIFYFICFFISCIIYGCKEEEKVFENKYISVDELCSYKWVPINSNKTLSLYFFNSNSGFLYEVVNSIQYTEKFTYNIVSNIVNIVYSNNTTIVEYVYDGSFLIDKYDVKYEPKSLTDFDDDIIKDFVSDNDDNGENNDDSSSGESEDNYENLTDKELDEKDAVDPRRGNVSNKFNGNGTYNSPYLISTSDDLRLLSDECRNGNTFSGKYFKQTADIFINRNVVNSLTNELNNDDNFERWIPIGRGESVKDYSFKGIYDGGNHIISGIYINRKDRDYIGLFGVVMNATIKNIVLKDSYIKCGIGGGIVGHNVGGSSIVNCHNYAVIEGVWIACGIASTRVDNVYKCSNYGKISVSGDDTSGANDIAAGICYISENIYDCLNFGNISGKYASGILHSVISGQCDNCVNRGDITGVSGAGGIVKNSHKSLVYNNVNLGVVRIGELEGDLGAIIGNSIDSNIQYNYYLSSKCNSLVGTNKGGSKKENNVCSDFEMKSSDVLNSLNNKRKSGRSSWKKFNKDSYPVLNWAY